jgi:hypothetical protein
VTATAAHAGAGTDFLHLDGVARLLDRRDDAVEPLPQVELLRRRDEQRDPARIDETGDTLAHQHAGPEIVRPDIRKAPADAGGRRMGGISEHRDAGGERLLDRLVEGARIDDRQRDRAGIGGNSAVNRVHHLGHVRGR